MPFTSYVLVLVFWFRETSLVIFQRINKIWKCKTASRCITVIQVYAPNSNKEAKDEWSYEDLQDLLELTPQEDVLFIIGHWNSKGGSQEIPGVTSKFGPAVQNEAGQRLTEFCPRECISHSKYFFNNTRDDFTHEHHQMVNTKIRLIIFFVAKTRSWLWLRSWIR